VFCPTGFGRPGVCVAEPARIDAISRRSVSVEVDDRTRLGTVARLPADAGHAEGAELHERDHDDTRDHGVIT